MTIELTPGYSVLNVGKCGGEFVFFFRAEQATVGTVGVVARGVGFNETEHGMDAEVESRFQIVSFVVVPAAKIKISSFPSRFLHFLGLVSLIMDVVGIPK